MTARKPRFLPPRKEKRPTSNRNPGRPGGVRQASLSGRIAAAWVIVAFVLGSCTDPGTTPGTPTVPATPTDEPETPGVTASVRPESPSTEGLSEDDAMAIGLSELARHMRRELGPDWVPLTQAAMNGHLVAAGFPPDSANALHDLMQSTMAARPAADIINESRIRSDFRHRVRESLGSPENPDVALDLRLPTRAAHPDDDGAQAESDYTCDEYNQCRGQNYKECYEYADLEVSVHEAWLTAGCAFVAALGAVVTLSTAAVLAGLCLKAPSYWSSLVHSTAMDVCFTTRCGSYPSCI